MGGLSLKNNILGTVKRVTKPAKVKDNVSSLCFPSSLSHTHILSLLYPHSNPENQNPGKIIPNNPETVEKKLKNAVT